jgi:hypothetical protein
MLITFSGRTPELLTLLPHISHDITVIGLTAHTTSSSCPLFSGRNPNKCILLPAPIHEPETVSFGLAAPTTSTTVALAVADALAHAIAIRLHKTPEKSPAEVFKANHPGGAIGATAAEESPPKMADIATSVQSVPIAIAQAGLPLRAIDIVLAAVRSHGGWVRTSAFRIVAPRRIQAFTNMDQTVQEMVELEGSPVLEKSSWISILASSTIEETRQWIAKMLAEPRGKTFLKPGTLLGIVDEKGEVSGVVEIEEITGEDFELVGGFGVSEPGFEEMMGVERH